MRTLSPSREVSIALSNGNSVKAVAFVEDTDRIGLECLTVENKRTRALFSREAVTAIVGAFNALIAGKGEPIKKEWRHVPDHELIERREEEETKKSISLPMISGGEILTLIDAIASQPHPGIFIPTQAIDDLRKAVASVGS